VAKVIFRQAFELGLTPIYLCCGDAPNLNRLDIFASRLLTAFSEQYQRPPASELDRIEKDRILLIIDEFELIRTNSQGRLNFLKSLAKQYERICIFSSDVIRWEDLAVGSVGASSLEEFTQYDLLEFGHKTRSELVEKWESHSIEQTLDEYEYQLKIQRTEEVLDQVLGRSYLPARPVYLLALLQGLSSSASLGSTVGTYGSLYELLISHQLAACDSSAPTDFTTRRAYLSELAFWMFGKNFHSFSEDEWKEFHRYYCEKYRVDYPRQRFVEDFLKCAIIDNRNGQFMFRYKYAYYYFVAKYLSDNLHSAEIANLVRQLSGQFEQEEHASIWLFLTHLSKNPVILEVITEHARGISSDREPANFDNDASFIQDFQGHVPQLGINTEEDFRSRKHKRLEQMDAADNRQDGGQRANPDSSEEPTPDSGGSFRDGMRTLRYSGRSCAISRAR
jgi:hypothetical protein